jgi:DNA-binding NarL/FixJ family response regulator
MSKTTAMILEIQELYNNGMTVQQIAGMLKITESYVKSAISLIQY